MCLYACIEKIAQIYLYHITETRDHLDAALSYRRTGGRAGRACGTALLPQPGERQSGGARAETVPRQSCVAVAHHRGGPTSPLHATDAFLCSRCAAPTLPHVFLPSITLPHTRVMAPHFHAAGPKRCRTVVLRNHQSRGHHLNSASLLYSRGIFVQIFFM
mgnify:CR=1 FL=1